MWLLPWWSCELGRLMAWLVMKAHQLVGAESERRVRSTVVVAEFDLVHSGRKILDNRAYLTPNEPLPRHILKKGNY
jgi:hypothetical protein